MWSLFDRHRRPVLPGNPGIAERGNGAKEQRMTTKPSSAQWRKACSDWRSGINGPLAELVRSGAALPRDAASLVADIVAGRAVQSKANRRNARLTEADKLELRIAAMNLVDFCWSRFTDESAADLFKDETLVAYAKRRAAMRRGVVAHLVSLCAGRATESTIDRRLGRLMTEYKKSKPTSRPPPADARATFAGVAETARHLSSNRTVRGPRDD